MEPIQTDCVFVLRNHDRYKTDTRLKKGLDLVLDGIAPMVMLPVAGNTKEEAQRLEQFVQQMDWERVLIVTDSDHIYRAYLTFIKWLPRGTQLYYSIVLPPMLAPSQREEEFRKIDVYSTYHDIATYEEGIEYLQWLKSLPSDQQLLFLE